MGRKRPRCDKKTPKNPELLLPQRRIPLLEGRIVCLGGSRVPVGAAIGAGGRLSARAGWSGWMENGDREEERFKEPRGGNRYGPVGDGLIKVRP